MQSTTIAVDTAKLVFEVVVSDGSRVIENHRLNRAEFQAFIVHQPPSRFVMEACGGSHHWARLMLAHGHSVRLLPGPYARAYRRRNKTDRADCMATLEADHNPEILSAPVKRVDAQAIQGLHRARSAWTGCRTARINALPGLLREIDAERTLQRFKATSRWHQQARRQVRPHAVDPRRTHRLARCPTQRERG